MSLAKSLYGPSVTGSVTVALYTFHYCAKAKGFDGPGLAISWDSLAFAIAVTASTVALSVLSMGKVCFALAGKLVAFPKDHLPAVAIPVLVMVAHTPVVDFAEKTSLRPNKTKTWANEKPL